MNKKFGFCSKKAIAGILVAAMMLSQSAVAVLADEVNTVSGDEVIAAETAETIVEQDVAESEDVVEPKTTEKAAVTELDGHKTSPDAPDEADLATAKHGSSYFKATISGPKSVTIEMAKSVKNAKYFRFYRVMQDGCVEPVLENDKWTTKTEFTDKAYDPETAAGIYMLKTYDKKGNELPAGFYAAICTTKVFQVSLVSDKVVRVAIERLRGTAAHPIYYDMKASTTDPYKDSKKIASFRTPKLGKAGDPAASHEYVDNGLSYSGRPCVTYTITMPDDEFEKAKKSDCYIELTPYVDLSSVGVLDDGDLNGTRKKISTKLSAPGVDIIYIGGHGVAGHDSCRTDMAAYVEDAGVDKNTTDLGTGYDYLDNKFASYLKSYAAKKRSYEIRKVDAKSGEETSAGLGKVTDFTKVTIVMQADGSWKEQPYVKGDEARYKDSTTTKVVRKVPLRYSEPNRTYTYRARVIVEEANFAGSYGIPYTHGFQFVTPMNGSICNVSTTKVKITFESEKCAKKYVVLRSKQKFDTEEEAVQYGNDMIANKDMTFKKLTNKRKGDAIGSDPNPYFMAAGSVENKGPDGSELTVQASVPSNGKYYTFLVCPQSSETGLDQSLIFGEHGWISSPKNVKADSSLDGITISWQKVGKATGYNLYVTTTTALNGTAVKPVFDYSNPDYTFQKGSTEFKKHKVTIPRSALDVNATYYFAVSTLVGGDESEPAGMNYAKAKIQTKPVKSIEIVPANDKRNNLWKKEAVIRFKAQKDYASVDEYRLEVYEYEPGTSNPLGTLIVDESIDAQTYVDGKKTKNVKSGSTLSARIGNLERSKVYTFVVYTVGGGVEGIHQEKEFAMPGAIEILNLEEKVLGHSGRENGGTFTTAPCKTFAGTHTFLNCNKGGADGSSIEDAYKVPGSGMNFLVATDTMSEGDYLRLDFTGSKSSIKVDYSSTKLYKGKNGKMYHYITLTPSAGASGMIKVKMLYTDDMSKSGSNMREPISGPWGKDGSFKGGAGILKTNENFYVKFN